MLAHRKGSKGWYRFSKHRASSIFAEGVFLVLKFWPCSWDWLLGSEHQRTQLMVMGSSPVEGVLLGVNLWLYSRDGLHGLEGRASVY